MFSSFSLYLIPHNGKYNHASVVIEIILKTQVIKKWNDYCRFSYRYSVIVIYSQFHKILDVLFWLKQWLMLIVGTADTDFFPQIICQWNIFPVQHATGWHCWWRQRKISSEVGKKCTHGSRYPMHLERHIASLSSHFFVGLLIVGWAHKTTFKITFLWSNNLLKFPPKELSFVAFLCVRVCVQNGCWQHSGVRGVIIRQFFVFF